MNRCTEAVLPQLWLRKAADQHKMGVPELAVVACVQRSRSSLAPCNAVLTDQSDLDRRPHDV